MSNDVIQIITAPMAHIWRLFTGFHIPGTNITPAMVLFFVPFVSLIMKFVKDLLSMNGPSGGDNVKK